MTSENPTPANLPEKFDLFSKSGQFQYSQEPDDVRAARLANDRLKLESETRQKEYDLSFQRRMEVFKTTAFTIVSIAAIGFGLYFCLQIINSSTSSEDAKKAAIATISSILTSSITGIAGYLAGSNKNSNLK
ncbi:hypothetical protein [Pseudanabaena sp. PCC 6802]|uniref:hypothetical protein n=1 Tax=Pseudanabaena sp. PCC 6802 TaxID=118173 RepID=UPI000375D6EE|nr:hypothetical protein [Pseudanabaena sp. PCC 6802]